MAYIIRPIEINDLEQFVKLRTQIFEESKFMLFNPGEFNPTNATSIAHLERVITSSHETIIVLKDETKLLGYITVTTNPLERVRHEAKITIGMLKAFQGKGFGRKLLKECEAWCIRHHIHRIELTVVKENTPALKLYQSLGFKIEGELKDKLLIDGQYYNEYIMSKILMTESSI